MIMALGMIEVFGFTTAIIIADIAAKSGNITVTAIDSNKPAAGDSAEVPLVMNVKIEGNVSDVEEAVKNGVAEAKRRGLYIVSHIIARPDMETQKLINLNALGRDKLNK